jgi:2-methylcitrate dehydratase PrpD
MFTQPRTAEIGILPLSFYGYLGAAAATAKAFEFNVEETVRALGHAFTQSAGYYVELGTDAHYLDSAYCCRNAITTAMLVKSGLTSSPNFEQLLKTLLGTDGVDINRMTENLGKPPFFIHNIWVKKYPCCFMTHRQIDALFELIEEHRFSYRQVEHVDLDVGPGDASVCNRPEPENGESAKFSYQHTLAAVMLEGRVEMDAFTDAKVANPLFARARSKVKVIIHPEWGPGTQVGIARVTVSLKDGRRLAKEMEQPLGAPKRPLSTEQIIDIYKKYVRATLSDKQMKRTMKTVLDLEKAKDAVELMNTLTFAQATG